MIKNGMKYCPYCKIWKPISDFCSDKARKDGLGSWCKSCISKWYRLESNKEWLNKKSKNWQKTEKGIKYLNSEKYRQMQNKASKKHAKTIKGIITRKLQVERRAKMNWIQIRPNPFAESVLVSPHHIDNDHFVYIPFEMHNAYRGYKTEIHREALKYIVEQIYGELNYD